LRAGRKVSAAAASVTSVDVPAPSAATPLSDTPTVPSLPPFPAGLVRQAPIRDVLVKLWSSDIKEREDALYCLATRDMTLVERSLVARLSIPMLVSILSSSSEYNAELATRVINSIVRFNQGGSIEALVDAGGVPALITLWHRSSERMKTIVANVIRNIAHWGGHTTTTIIIHSGFCV